MKKPLYKSLYFQVVGAIVVVAGSFGVVGGGLRRAQ